MYIKNRQLVATGNRTSAHGSACTVVVMYGDLREFSTWSNTVAPEIAANLIQEQYERVLQIVNDHHPDFCKFLGDGFLLLWDTDEKMTVELCLRFAIDAAYHLHHHFHQARIEERGKLPSGYGVGISVGSAIRIQPQTIISEFNEIDFVGYPLNCGARMQTLAGPFGVVMCSTAVEIIEKDSDTYLYPNDLAFARVLTLPTAASVARAASLRGLQRADQTRFRYLTWPSQVRRWGSDGFL